MGEDLKIEIRISKSENILFNLFSMAKSEKIYDLEERTALFAKRIRNFVRALPNINVNWEDGKQLIRSSGSVGANYIEANESLSDKDFIHRIKICRKEAKESRYWLRLVFVCHKEELNKDRKQLMQEAKELMNMFGSIVRNYEKNNRKQT